MPNITPAQLSLELNVSQKRIRGILRELYGTLPEATTRWMLTDEQAEKVRARIGRSARAEPAVWTLEPGDTVHRRALHGAYNGSRQNGIVTLKTLPDILVFTDVRSGSAFGYHLFEGLQEDGSYSYTGEGQRGDQQLTRGNRALAESGSSGRPIRLFTVQGTSVTHVGEFATGDPTYWERTIPDVDGNPRTGLIFNLVPVDAAITLLAPESALKAPRADIEAWTPPKTSDVVVAVAAPEVSADRVVSRLEFALQSDFGTWLRAGGDEPRRLRLTSHGATIEPDLYVESRGWIVEAKKSSGREYVRTAIGQVLDYVHVAEQAGRSATPVVLLPSRPTPDLVELLGRHGITLVVRHDDEFEIVSSGF
ncbi:hypothetical protein [Leifsonia virtsii]|uniref:ScoMcrA-like SRA domain-containing protein n=1 Tax=Leifsonia virtsii TaxID=3035915 RepID=A0ABT8IXP6_9MICO|nr:hypothetical protein [Leifsonia virtsii]MDN4597596.1 hypothetical protein [Leifsonia virtsii]